MSVKKKAALEEFQLFFEEVPNRLPFQANRIRRFDKLTASRVPAVVKSTTN